MDSAISIRGLTKEFSDKTVVDKVSLEIPKGAVYGLIGPNGAGKTTTVRMLSTLIKPSAGTAVVNGFDVISEPQRVRSSIGVLPEDTGLYDRLTARETLAFYGGVQGLDGLDLAKRIGKLLKMFDLEERIDDRVGKYSKGMRQKLALARALIHDPPVLLLDEPTLGLDVMSTRAIRDYIKNVAREGKTVLLTSNNLYEAQLLSDQVAILNRGAVKASGTVEELESMAKAKGLEDVFVNLVRAESNV
ncbi:MAG: ABC transporter ATP-binding protein [Nitrososphaerales archaeon]|nr:ABC transporter ATP-binding protein [Nitrososphaerales archaeon]